MVIPKTILQIGRDKKFLDIKLYFDIEYSEYKYLYFTDIDAINFLEQNIDHEFPNIVQQFKLLKGAHKADLFRYYFLYKFGGIYFDTDMELLTRIENIIEDFEFITIKTGNSIAMNGFIASIPKHEIVYKALKHIYSFNYKQSNDYLYFCKELWNIINSQNYQNIKIHTEYFIKNNRTVLKNDSNLELAYHHYRYKDDAYKNILKKTLTYPNDENLIWGSVFNNK